MPSLLARAKVNLCLHVGGRRPDGLHDIATLAVFPALGDIIAAEPADDLTLAIDGPFAPALGTLKSDDNLVMRAARLLQSETGRRQGARITLTKHLPPASGIGGGTADAAAALILLRDLWQDDISDAALSALSFRLGADGPLCLMPYLTGSASAVAQGAGEQIAPGPILPPLWICLANPRRHVPTGPVFAGLSPRGAGTLARGPAMPVRFADHAALTAFLETTTNDLADPAMALCPEIAAVGTMLSNMPGCLIARMSGSGATCFGLFASAAAAQRAARRAEGEGWWAQAAALEACMPKAFTL